MRILAVAIVALVLRLGGGSAVHAGCPAVSDMTRIHDSGRALERFLTSPAYTGIGALVSHGMATSDATTYVSRSGEVVVVLPLVSDGEVLGAVAYSTHQGVAVACHLDVSGRLRMTYADKEGYVWTRYWNTDSLSDVTVLSDSSGCMDACNIGCGALCGKSCVGAGPGYIACVAACFFACRAICKNMCEGEGGGGGGGGSEPPAVNSIP